jgi:pyridoxamine 5'-phosphate oxidase
MSIADIRKSYEKFELVESSAGDNPFELFTTWFNEALKAELPDANAMTLATVASDGRPSARIVLLKGYDDAGFTFFTNYESRKGREIAGNPQASLLFFWPGLERQIRIEGTLQKVEAAESDAYFASRPLGSRIGAWASPQSQPITREELEHRSADFTQRLGNNPARPPHWGGYRLTPQAIEFWQGRPSRLHDRLYFTRSPEGQWNRNRLAP